LSPQGESQGQGQGHGQVQGQGLVNFKGVQRAQCARLLRRARPPVRRRRCQPAGVSASSRRLSSRRCRLPRARPQQLSASRHPGILRETLVVCCAEAALSRWQSPAKHPESMRRVSSHATLRACAVVPIVVQHSRSWHTILFLSHCLTNGASAEHEVASGRRLSHSFRRHC
jgi:hypothetical protein